MNALTDSEAQALHAIPAPQVPAQPSQQMLLVPLSRLRPSRRNVRKTVGPSIEALAASIERWEDNAEEFAEFNRRVAAIPASSST